METIHIEGYADQIDLPEKLSDNYALDWNFCYDEETPDTVKNVFFRFYECDEPKTLDEAIKGYVNYLFGNLDATGYDTGYSEYTIEGFSITSLKLGGHDLDKILKSKGHKYLLILNDVVPEKKDNP